MCLKTLVLFPLKHHSRDYLHVYVFKKTGSVWKAISHKSAEYLSKKRKEKKQERGNSNDAFLSDAAKTTSKRFLYKGRRKLGDILKASPDTQQNWPTFFHSIAPVSPIALVMHNFFHKRKEKHHNAAEMGCTESMLEGCSFIVQNKVSCFYKLMKSLSSHRGFIKTLPAIHVIFC